MTNPDQKLEAATAEHRAGHLPEARRLYLEVLAETPNRAVARFQLGLLEMQAQRFEQALNLVQQVVNAAPDEPKFQFGLGEIFSAMKRWEEAVTAYRRVLEHQPQSADAHFSMGCALHGKGDLAAAITAYQAAVQIQPDFADAFNNLGNCYKLQNNLTEAEAAYRQALAVRPNHAGAMANLAAVMQAHGDTGQAIELLHAAIALEPGVVPREVNLAALLCQQRRFADAESVLLSAIAREPDNAKAFFNLGNALHGLDRPLEAVEQYRKAIALRPGYAHAFNNLGNVCKELGKFNAAAVAYESAMRARPDFIPAINNLGCLLRTLGRLEDAEAVLRRGLLRDVNHSALHDNLGSVLKDAGRLDEAIDCFRQSVQLDPTGAATHSNLAYALSFQAEEPSPILQECLRWNEQHAMLFQSQIAVHPNDKSPIRRLRIGYVSPDFRDHCQSLFTIPLLSHHDHTAFEIVCYSSVQRPDELTRRISGYADLWREVRSLNDSALCDQIRADQIDILVDLTMHMADGRPLVFARKPAPIQVAWLAYPGTTGIRAIDYRFTDPRLDPPGFENHYSEKTVRLPDSFWCYDPLTNAPATNDLPALSKGHITFGCLNNPCKLTNHTLQLWGSVMRALPDAKLLLMAPPGGYREHLLLRLSADGIAGERVNFVQYRPRADYLRSYHDIDLGLDTFPYNGHTTSLDSFWMGVPVVSRVGDTCVGRGGLSQLFQLDLAELAAETDDRFIAAAVATANDLPRLAMLRQQLRSRLSDSPLMNADRFARNMEAAYQKIWRDYCTSQDSQKNAQDDRQP